MSFKSISLALIASFTFAASAIAGDSIAIEGAYARSSTMKSTSGAIFMTIVNSGAQDDRLIAAQSSIAKKVELHTHKEGENGVMQMLKIEGGIGVSAGETHGLKRGGDHVMLMGLTESLAQDDVISVTLTFEKAGEMTIDVPVDLTR